MGQEIFVTLYEYPIISNLSGPIYLYTTGFLGMLGVLIAGGLFDWINTFFARSTYSPLSQRRPFNGKLKPRLLIAGAFIVVATLSFSVGKNRHEHRASFEAAIVTTIPIIHAGVVQSIKKDFVEVPTGQILVARKVQVFRSFQVDDLILIAGDHYAVNDFRHFNVSDRPFDVGDQLRISMIKNRVVKVEKVRASIKLQR